MIKMQVTFSLIHVQLLAEFACEGRGNAMSQRMKRAEGLDKLELAQRSSLPTIARHLT